MLAISVAASLALGGLVARADDILPKPFPASRYEKMGAHSPFSPPTSAVIAAPVITTPAAGWADKLSVTNVMERDGGKLVADVLDRESSQHFRVYSDADPSNPQQMRLTNVQWADKAADTRITIQKGKETAQLAFDPAANAAASPLPLAGLGTAPPRLPQTVFHPPPAPNPGVGGPSSIVRRPMINSAPPLPAQNAPRPIVARPAAKPAADDDDDDDQ